MQELRKMLQSYRQKDPYSGAVVASALWEEVVGAGALGLLVMFKCAVFDINPTYNH